MIVTNEGSHFLDKFKPTWKRAREVMKTLCFTVNKHMIKSVYNTFLLDTFEVKMVHFIKLKRLCEINYI